MRLLLVEDDPVLSDILAESLQAWRYLVEIASDGQMGWEYVESATYDLLLIDVGLPKLDGISLCQKIRSAGYSTPILLMTGREKPSDRIKGLDAGADDYLIKPINLEELQARLRALARRGQVSPSSVLTIGELRLDPKTCQVTYQDQPLRLTPKEYNLLELFMRNPERLFSRAQLLELLWTFDDSPLEETVKAHIKGLRQRFKKVGISEWIENIYGLGYRFNPQLTTIQDKFKQEQEKIWQQYQGLMQERLDALGQVVNALARKTLNEESKMAGIQAAHKLAGVLGMLDREEGSVIAKKIEKLLDSNQLDYQQLKDLTSKLSQNLGLNPSLEPSLTKFLLIAQDLSLGEALMTINREWKQVNNLSEASSWLEQTTPELIVLVLETKEMIESLVQLTKRSPSIPVVVIAAEDNLETRLAIANLGAKSFLVQPVTPQAIWQQVTQILETTPNHSIRILGVDDDPVLLATLDSLLKPWGINFLGVEDPQQVWHTLQSFKPDLLILDVDMPQINGIDLCRTLRNDPSFQDLPILFLTAHQEISFIQQIFAVGADDYLTKPVVAPELLTRINYRLERQQMLQKYFKRDALTGLLNQRQSWEELELMIKQKQLFSLALISLRDLRQINFEYGHDFGRQILKSWGKIIQSYFQGSEILGYWGEGEFIIGIPFLSKTQSLEKIEDLLHALRTQIFTTVHGVRLSINYNYSLVEYPKDGLMLQSLYRIMSEEYGRVI